MQLQKGKDVAGFKAAARGPSKTSINGFAKRILPSKGATEFIFIQGYVDPPRYHSGNTTLSQALFIVSRLLVKAVIIKEKNPKNRFPSVNIRANFHQQK